MSIVGYSVNDRIVTITLNRPEKKNALNAEMVIQLNSMLKKADNDEKVKIIILKAKGSAFSAGADLDYLRDLSKFSYAENKADSLQLKDMFYQIYSMSKLVIAQVEGFAIAGGAGLATVCDFVFSVPEAKFGFTEVKIGFVPAIVSVFALRKFGESQTRKLLLSGDLISAKQAKKIGLVHFIAGQKVINQKVKEFANKLVEKTSANSLTLTKKLISGYQQNELVQALNYAAELNAKTRNSDDCVKGINSFLKKEKIVW